MAPKRHLSSSKVVRLAQHEVLEQLHAWDVTIPDGAEELDLRAMLARVMAGKSPLLASLQPVQSEASAGGQQPAPEGPWPACGYVGRRSIRRSDVVRTSFERTPGFDVLGLYEALICEESPHCLHHRCHRALSTVRVASKMWTSR